MRRFTLTVLLALSCVSFFSVSSHAGKWKKAQSQSCGVRGACPTGLQSAPVYAYATTQQVPTAQPQATLATQPNASGDLRSEFLSHLNAGRAARGLSAVGYSAQAEQDCQVNNSHQRARGIGHFHLGSHRRQNAAMGSYSGGTLYRAWEASPGHAAGLFDSSLRVVGLAYDGLWATFGGL